MESKEILKCKGKNRNNGLIKKCKFKGKFPANNYSYNCPICNYPLRKKKRNNRKKK